MTDVSHQICDCHQMLLTLDASLVCMIQSPQLQAQLPTQKSSSCSCCRYLLPLMTCFAGGMIKAGFCVTAADRLCIVVAQQHAPACLQVTDAS